MSRPPRIALAVGATLAIALSTLSCSGDDSDETTSDVTGLCDAVRAADASDPGRASAVFHDSAHEPLHELARQLEESDRAQAARLLEAKQKVEAAIERDALTSDDLDPLVAVVDTSLRLLGRAGLPCASQ